MCAPELTAIEPESSGQVVTGLDFHKFYFDAAAAAKAAGGAKPPSQVRRPPLRVSCARLCVRHVLWCLPACAAGSRRLLCKTVPLLTPLRPPLPLLLQSAMAGVSVRLVSPRVAVVAYTRLVQRTTGGTGASSETRVWVFEAGVWRNAHFHRSPITTA
jgi:hypothetical protein